MSECYILNAEAYPHDDESIAIHLLYAESAEKLQRHELMSGKFFVSKEVAQTVTKQVMDILIAPDTATAWADIMDVLPETNERFEVEENNG